MPVQTLGIIGGGQLGRMLTIPAKQMGYDVVCIDPTPNCPASQVGARQIEGSLSDRQALQQLFELSDVVTWEIEHIDTEVLGKVAANSEAVLRPPISDLKMIQDKLRQKQFLDDAGIAVAEFEQINGRSDVEQCLENWGGLVLKSRKGGFDGRGNFVVRNQTDIDEAFGSLDGDLYAERLVDFSSEVAAIVVKGSSEVLVYPAIDTVHEDNICVSCTVPSRLGKPTQGQVVNLANKTARQLQGPGVFAIEMFVTDSGVLVNEIAPRVHNSGHLTIEASVTSQFENHVRAVFGLPVGDTSTKVATAAMVNILGRKAAEFSTESLRDLPEVKVHWYGKAPVKPARKMGHITATSQDAADDVLSRCLQAREKLDL